MPVTKMGKGMPVTSAKRSKLFNKGLPFKDDSVSEEKQYPRNQKAKHRAWLLAGLRAMKAPVVTW